jgi:Dual OB-containing domain
MAPKYQKLIVCLANSRKMTGRCLAGKEVMKGGYGGWIRPVSKRESGEVSEEERRYEDGQDPKLLDIVRIPMEAAKPHSFQTENHLIDDGYYWTNTGRATVDDIRKAVDVVKGPLWDNSSSSSNGLNDRVSEVTANKLKDSLKLIEVEDLSVEVALEGAAFGNGKRKVRGRFSAGGNQYKLAVTDPVIERKYLAGENGAYRIGPAILCISLGEPFDGYAYKLIAGVILP